MSILTLTVDEVMRTLSSDGQYPFVVKDKTVDIVRFALNTGFTDITLDEHSALRVMYQRPGETEVKAQTLTYYDTDGLRNFYDWKLAQSDLVKSGTLTVALCILSITGGEVSEWHTTPCAVKVLSTIHTDDSDEGDDTITPTVKERVAVLESMIQRVASGTPIVVSSTSAMTDTDQIYVLTTDGYWYYYDGSAWQQGGEYGAITIETDTTLSVEGMPADAAAVGEAIEEVKKHTGGYTVPNLYDKDNKVGTMTINGTSISGLSNWIPIRQGVTYSTDYTSTQFYFFDTEKNYLSATTLVSTINRIRPDADGYLLVRTKGADKTVIEGTYLEYAPGIKCRWNGKKWLALGDSITTSGSNWAAHGYPYYVGSWLGMKATNVASGGKTMDYYHNLIDGYSDDYDLITVMLGTNNQGYNCGIGALNDEYYQQGNYSSNASFYAQTQHLVDLLQAKYPNAVIAFFTPLRRSESASDGTYKVNTLGLTTEAYANAVKAVCEYYNIPCLDLYTQNIDPKFDWIRAAYFVNGDGTHPNDLGHKRYTAPAIADFLERLAPFDDVETEEEAET